MKKPGSHSFYGPNLCHLPVLYCSIWESELVILTCIYRHTAATIIVQLQGTQYSLDHQGSPAKLAQGSYHVWAIGQQQTTLLTA